MGGHKKKGSTFDPRIPPPEADYNVTGEISPDATCNYIKAGTYDGKPYYRRSDGAWFIWWWAGPTRWIISATLGDATPPIWFRIEHEIIGPFDPFEPATGTAQVAAGPH